MISYSKYVQNAVNAYERRTSPLRAVTGPYEQYTKDAVAAYERRMLLPRGWWGEYHDFRNPAGDRVFSDRSGTGAPWVAQKRDGDTTRHETRTGAIWRLVRAAQEESMPEGTEPSLA